MSAKRLSTDELIARHKWAGLAQLNKIRRLLTKLTESSDNLDSGTASVYAQVALHLLDEAAKYQEEEFNSWKSRAGAA